MACIGPAQTWVKDPQSTLDYVFDWSHWLGVLDQITSAVFSATPGIDIVSETFEETQAEVWLGGGTDGNSYDVTCHIHTLGGRRDERTARIQCQHR